MCVYVYARVCLWYIFVMEKYKFEYKININ